MIATVSRGLLVFAAIWGYVRLFSNTFIDDAFISLKYSAMLATRGEWAFLPGRTSNTATSPLNVVAHAVVSRFTPSMVEAVILLTALELTLILALLLRISRKLFGNPLFGALAFVAIATNCLLVSTFGLESVLFTLLLVWSVDRFVAEDWTLLAVALAGVVMARPDGALLVPIYAAVLAKRRALSWKVLGAFALTMAPWVLYSWIHLGSFVPDTLQIKFGQTGWGRNLTLFSGLGFYFRRYPLETLASFSLLPFVLVAWRSRSREVRVVASMLALYTVAHMAAYSAMKIPPYHWYYVNQVAPVALLGALGVANLLSDAWERARGASRLAIGSLVLVPAIGLMISMARLGLPLKEAPMHTNWGTHEQYRAVGQWLRDNLPESESVYEVSEIGTVGFYADRMLVNEFSDGNRTFGAILERYPRLPRPAQIAIDLNYYWRRIQPEVREPAYSLVHYTLPNPEEPKFAENIVTSWETSTRWTPQARLYLLRRTVKDPAK